MNTRENVPKLSRISCKLFSLVIFVTCKLSQTLIVSAYVINKINSTKGLPNTRS